MNQGGEPNEPVCPHLDIVWGGGFVTWVRPEYADLVSEVMKRREELMLQMRREGGFCEEELPDPLDAVMEADPTEPCLVITCRTTSMACGPVEDTCTAVLRPMRDAFPPGWGAPSFQGS